MTSHLLRAVVENSEVVVPGGMRTTRWLVYADGKWVRPSILPRTQIDRLRWPGPGVVWRETLSLELEPNAQLLRIDIQPRGHEENDPLASLWRSPSKTRQLRSYFRLSPGGSLLRISGPARCNK